MEQTPAIFDSFYEIVGELGRGTTGTVYEARCKTLNRRVALTVPDLSPDAERPAKAQRFLRQCRALARLTSEPGCNIPRLHAVAECPESRPYSIRELVEGRSLEQRVAEESIDLRAGLAVVARLARMVEWVHSQGFVHRNLSPTNVLVGRDSTPWLIGFGRVGLLAGSPLALSGVGTPAEVDARGLQGLLQWLFGALRQPVPTGLAPVLAGSVASVGGVGAALVSHVRGGPAEPAAAADRGRRQAL